MKHMPKNSTMIAIDVAIALFLRHSSWRWSSLFLFPFLSFFTSFGRL